MKRNIAYLFLFFLVVVVPEFVDGGQVGIHLGATQHTVGYAKVEILPILAETTRMWPGDISTSMLSKLRQSVESYFGKIEEAVIIVPAYFTAAQRHGIEKMWGMVGVDVAQVIDEPSAAAIAYGVEKRKKRVSSNILIYNIGFRGFDATIFNIENGVIKVLSTWGDTHLGGEEFDLRVVNYFVEVIEKKYHKVISQDERAMELLRRECETAKRGLTRQQRVQVKIKSLFDDIEFSENLTRVKFEKLNIHLFNKTLQLVKKALKVADLSKNEIHDSVLVGYDTNIPKVKKSLMNFFDGKKPFEGVNPESGPAYGAAFQAGKQVGGFRLFLNVAPLSLGIGTTEHALMLKMIPRNSGIPIKKSLVLSTQEGHGNGVIIKVYQGERSLAKDCRALAIFPTTPKEVAHIEVTLEVDADGTLHMKAVALDIVHGRYVHKPLKWEAYDNLTKEITHLYEADIDILLKEAEEMAEKDRKAVKNVRVWMKGKKYVSHHWNAANMLAHAMNSDVKEKLENTLKKILEWFDANQLAEISDIEEKQKEVDAVWTPIIKQIYESSADDDEEFGKPEFEL